MILVPARVTQRSVSIAYLTARSKVFTLGNDALVVINVVLPAVLGLVHVREAGIEACDTPKLVSIVIT